MGSLSERFIGPAIASMLVLLLAFSGAFILFASEEDELTADAAMATTKDGAGYFWIDSNQPEPRVEYEWIDATTGTVLSGVKYTYDTAGSQQYNLPFAFEFYGSYYTSLWVFSCGFLDFEPLYSTYSYPYYYNIPYSGYHNGFIAPWMSYLGAYSYYGQGNFKVYALEGQTYGEKWVCFQWDKAYLYYSYSNQGSSYEVTFQCILYESGLIKFQYLDTDSAYTWGSNGLYGTAGIEGPTGTIGVQYSYNQANLKNNMAVMIGKNLANINSVTADTDNGAAYAMYRDYGLTVECTHPIDNDMIRVVAATVGPDLAELLFLQNMDGSFYFSKSDPNSYILLDTPACTMEEVSGAMKVTFKFSPTFAYPMTDLQDVKVKVLGAGVMPASKVVEDVFWVENKLTVIGALMAYSMDKGYIENGGWLRGNEDFFFKGMKAVYPSTILSPMAGAIHFTITDEVGSVWVQTEVVAGYTNIPVRTESDYIRKTYTLSITNVPPGTDISQNPMFIINIDPINPLPPKDVFLHADAYDDRNTEFDNDLESFVSWEPAEDFESSIRGYFVADYDPLMREEPTRAGNVVFVTSPDTQTRFTFSSVGLNKVWVWAIDKAGNPSISAVSMTKVDVDEVSFSEFSPGDQRWVNTHTPMVSILVDDHGGSGVSAKDIQYSTSTTNTREYGPWISGGASRNMDQLRFSVKANFVNGKTNWVRFRAKDLVGNGNTTMDNWTVSGNYNVWVDEEAPLYANFRPYETEYQNGEIVVVSLDITDKHATRDGSGIKLDTVEYRFSTSGKGLYGDWLPAPISSISSDGVVHIESEMRFKEGDQNYIQFRCYDNVGIFSLSREFNIKVNSAPHVKAFLAEPKNGIDYTSDEKILFDASDTKDPDGDEMSYTWYSDIDGYLSSAKSFFRALSPGVHNITLIVNDPAHSVVAYFEALVLEPAQIDPMSIDTDGDGIYDAWEVRYGLKEDVSDSFIDTDHDTFTNFQEFQNGTDPVRASSHPPYPEGVERVDATKRDDKADQYRSITLALLLVGLIVVIVLILLALSKRRMFLTEVEEEKELESDEADYRNALETKRSERLNMQKK